MNTNHRSTAFFGDHLRHSIYTEGFLTRGEHGLVQSTIPSPAQDHIMFKKATIKEPVTQVQNFQFNIFGSICTVYFSSGGGGRNDLGPFSF